MVCPGRRFIYESVWPIEVSRLCFVRFSSRHVLEKKAVKQAVAIALTKEMEWNAVVNPAHPQFKRLVVGDPISIVWGKRLFERKP